jgi:hypothetical protein
MLCTWFGRILSARFFLPLLFFLCLFSAPLHLQLKDGRVLSEFLVLPLGDLR